MTPPIDAQHMTPPIDILEVAARELYHAERAVHGATIMNQSEAASRAHEYALTRYQIAAYGVDSARALAVELAQAAP